MRFSDEDRFIFQHWQVIKQLQDAVKGFEDKITESLHSIEGQLTKKPWWNDSIAWQVPAKGEVFISHKNGVAGKIGTPSV